MVSFVVIQHIMLYEGLLQNSQTRAILFKTMPDQLSFANSTDGIIMKSKTPQQKSKSLGV